MVEKNNFLYLINMFFVLGLMVKLTKKTYIYIYIQSLSLSGLYLSTFLFQHGSYSFDSLTSVA